MPLVLRGKADTPALLVAVQGILDRYEVLRTRLVSEDGRLYQQIDPVGILKVHYEDWSARGEAFASIERQAIDRCAEVIAAPYDLGMDHPCRSLVLKLSEELHVWCFAVHHSVGDNWSLSHVMPSDFFALYEAARDGRSADLPEISLHYADYAAWQRSEAMAGILEQELDWWKRHLNGAPEVLELPFDHARPAERKHEGRRTETAGFTSEQWRAIEAYAVARGGTPFMVFVAALSGLLSRVTPSGDIVLGTPHVMKPDAALWDEFGYFGNTLSLRTQVDHEETFNDLFDRAKGTVNDAFAHQYVPFEEIVAALGLRPVNETPVFQVLLVMHA
ncbi:condensation domain-containing protein, partial [Roseibium sp. RKSG952]|uniref:condensation domain-containing protein n=1 Tax=Roseibium sp. RKSG952 TaxID=2529384 RepID=UPI001FCB62F5